MICPSFLSFYFLLCYIWARGGESLRTNGNRELALQLCSLVPNSVVYPLDFVVFPLNPPPVWVPLNSAPCLVHDDPAARRPKKGLRGLCVRGPPALCACACRIGQVSRWLLGCLIAAGLKAETWTSRSVSRQCAKARRTPPPSTAT